MPILLHCKKNLAMRETGAYIRVVRRFPLYILGRFLPKLGGAFGHRPFFTSAIRGQEIPFHARQVFDQAGHIPPQGAKTRQAFDPCLIHVKVPRHFDL